MPQICTSAFQNGEFLLQLVGWRAGRAGRLGSVWLTGGLAGWRAGWLAGWLADAVQTADRARCGPQAKAAARRAAKAAAAAEAVAEAAAAGGVVATPDSTTATEATEGRLPSTFEVWGLQWRLLRKKYSFAHMRACD